MNMGIGRLGNSNLIVKRKFRWTFEVLNICGHAGRSIPPSFVKLASRPNLTVEETEINYLNAKTWIPGKASWETITVTYIDVASNDNKELYNWLASVYNFANPVTLEMGSSRANYAATANLVLYDGCGQPLEQWTLNDLWPTSVNWGDLDMGSSEEATVELTLRYSSVDYRSLCPDFVPQACCTPCDATSGGTGIVDNNFQNF